GLVIRHQRWTASERNKRRTNEVRSRQLREHSLGSMDAGGCTGFDCALCFLARSSCWSGSTTVRGDDFLRSHNPDDRESRGDCFLYQRLACRSGNNAVHQPGAHFGGSASILHRRRSKSVSPPWYCASSVCSPPPAFWISRPRPGCGLCRPGGRLHAPVDITLVCAWFCGSASAVVVSGRHHAYGSQRGVVSIPSIDREAMARGCTQTICEKRLPFAELTQRSEYA